jgi:hypothetical protein
MPNLSKPLVRQIVSQSKKRPTKALIKRDKYLQQLKQLGTTDLVKIITGFRRVGKSTLLKSFIQELAKTQGIPSENFFYINFELDLAQDIKSVSDLRLAFELIKSDLNNSHPQYVIFDEVQKIPNWEGFIRTLHETANYQIFISGSNSQLLSSELSTALGGRYLSLHVLPFSLIEYIKLLGAQNNKAAAPESNSKSSPEFNHDLYNPESIAYQQARDYIENGGLPETIGLPRNIAHNYIENVFNKVIIDDIGQRYAIRKLGIMRQLYKFTLGNTSGITSANNIAQRLELSPTTVKTYLSYYINSFSLYPINKYDVKLYSVFDETNKYYPVDSSLFAVAEHDINFSQKLESQVFIMLQSIYPDQEIMFGRDYHGHEIDFMIKLGEKEFIKIQVTDILHEGNLDRELGNFKLVSKYCSGPNLLLYMNDGRKQKNQPDGIKLLPAPVFLYSGFEAPDFSL